MVKNNYAVPCPNCRQLVNKDSLKCPNCSMPAPGKLSFFNILNRLDLSRFILGLIGINLFFYALSLILTALFSGPGGGFIGFLSPAPGVLRLMGWAYPGEALSGSYWQLISAVFLHGGVFHILMGMLWLNDLSKIGSHFFKIPTLFTVYIFSGIGGNVLAMLIGGSPVVGSSGALFGLMGVVIAFGYFGNSLHAKMYMIQLGKWALILLVLGFILPGISNSAHIGGLITGAIFGYALAKKSSYRSIGWNLLFGISALMTAVTFFIMISRILSIFIP